MVVAEDSEVNKGIPALKEVGFSKTDRLKTMLQILLANCK